MNNQFNYPPPPLPTAQYAYSLTPNPQAINAWLATQPPPPTEPPPPQPPPPANPPPLPPSEPPPLRLPPTYSKPPAPVSHSGKIIHPLMPDRQVNSFYNYSTPPPPIKTEAQDYRKPVVAQQNRNYPRRSAEVEEPYRQRGTRDTRSESGYEANSYSRTTPEYDSRYTSPTDDLRRQTTTQRPPETPYRIPMKNARDASKPSNYPEDQRRKQFRNDFSVPPPPLPQPKNYSNRDDLVNRRELPQSRYGPPPSHPQPPPPQPHERGYSVERLDFRRQQQPQQQHRYDSHLSGYKSTDVPADYRGYNHNHNHKNLDEMGEVPVLEGNGSWQYWGDNRQKRTRLDSFTSQDQQQPGKRKKHKPHRSSSEQTPSKWNREDALKALEVEQELSSKQKSHSLLIRFPDPDLTKEIVRSFHPAIENVHFQQASTPRYCHITLDPSSDTLMTMSALNRQKFGGGKLVVECKRDKEETQNVLPHDIDPYTLYVDNISPEVSKERIQEKYPKCVEINIGTAQKMKNSVYAFVTFACVEDAIQAFNDTGKLDMDSRNLKVRFRRVKGNIGMPGESKIQNPRKPTNDTDAQAQEERDAALARVASAQAQEKRDATIAQEEKDAAIAQEERDAARARVTNAQAQKERDAALARVASAQAQDKRDAARARVTNAQAQKEKDAALARARVPSAQAQDKEAAAPAQTNLTIRAEELQEIAADDTNVSEESVSDELPVRVSDIKKEVEPPADPCQPVNLNLVKNEPASDDDNSSDEDFWKLSAPVPDASEVEKEAEEVTVKKEVEESSEESSDSEVDEKDDEKEEEEKEEVDSKEGILKQCVNHVERLDQVQGDILNIIKSELDDPSDVGSDSEDSMPTKSNASIVKESDSDDSDF